MFSGKLFITDSSEIPQEWIFETYLGLSEKLTGQDVKLKSIFNAFDTNPSMILHYYPGKGYRYKCFSTGNYGTGYDLVSQLFGLTFIEAFNKVKEDYIEFLRTGNVYSTSITTTSRWKVAEIVYRKWNTDDVAFWTKYNIGSKLLEHHKVIPVKSYKMQFTSESGIVEKEFEVANKHMYCYQNSLGEPCKMYQPFNKNKKFIVIKNYLQGSEQLDNHDYMVITSSLKDIMATKSLNLKIDLVAPSSENAILSEETIEEFKTNYKAVVTMMDSDEAGIKSMLQYKEKYGLPLIYMPLEKDISDMIKIYGKTRTLYEFYPKLSSALEKYSVTL